MGDLLAYPTDRDALTSAVREAGRARVLLLVTLAETGGAQRYVAALIPALVERYDLTVAAHGDGPVRDAALAAGAHFVPLVHLRRSLNPWHDALGLVELVSLLRRVRPAIVHANSSKAGILGRLAGSLVGVPNRVFTVHGWAFAAHSGFASRVYLLADRLVSPLTSLVICVAESERSAGVRARTCRRDRTIVIRNAVDGHAPQTRYDRRVPTIVSVGRLAWPKDYVGLVRALARLEPGTFRARLVGDGPDRRQVEAEIRANALEGVIELLGNREDVPDILATADVFCLCSTSEALPFSILEAMAAGLPVVASSVGGIAEAIVDGESGLLVPAGDVSAFASALGRLVADRALRERLGSAARAGAVAEFGLARFHREHLEAYERLLSTLPRRARSSRGVAGDATAA